MRKKQKACRFKNNFHDEKIHLIKKIRKLLLKVPKLCRVLQFHHKTIFFFSILSSNWKKCITVSPSHWFHSIPSHWFRSINVRPLLRADYVIFYHLRRWCLRGTYFALSHLCVYLIIHVGIYFSATMAFFALHGGNFTL